MHIGFIVDGNRRWAKEHQLPTFEGHKRGLSQIEMTVETLAKAKVDYATFYVFSTENWGRSEEEVGNLMQLAASQIPRLARKMAKSNVRFIILGSDAKVSPDLLQKLRAAKQETAHCSGLTACFCFNYGGQQEIADAARALALEYKDAAHAAMHSPTGAPSAADFFTPEALSRHVYHPEIPPLDMIVRTSGEERLSGFMLWRAAYAEFLFLDKYYPDLTEQDITDILKEYNKRNRRYGK